MVITRKSLLLTLLALSICLATLSFALNTVLAEEEINVVPPRCYIDERDVEVYWCGPDNKYYWAVYDVYWCEDGRSHWEMKRQEIVSDNCPY